ncbi:MAG: SAM-dependent methyltransferase, partial [Magnetospiraceae bacterium]
MTDQFPSALFRFFEAMPRQGPGAAAITRALYDRFRPSTRSAPKVADMGCGSGAAGLVLAEAGARVTGVDVHKPFLDSFTERAKRRGLADRVETQCASMIDSGLGDGTQDMIWSEGAVFTVGFDTALAAFHGLLRVGGRVVLSECSWLQDPALAPADIQSY